MTLSLPAQVIFGVALAATLAFAATPMAIHMARRFAFYDLPKGYKAHGTPTPYLGGIAVISAFTVATLVAANNVSRTLPVLASGGVLLVVGTIDDRRTVSPHLRVVVELILGASLAALDLGWRLGAGEAVDCVVTAAWVVGVVNAFNLFDNMDGASSTLAAVTAAGVCALAVVTGNGWVAAGSAALCGACLGFLPHNLSSPAKIFLGDGGSMPLGLAVAMLAANAARSAEPGFLALLVGFLLVGVPALDTALVIVSRTRRGISVLTGGRDHLTHRTRMRMRTPGRVALVLGAAQGLLSAMVILASQAGSPELVYIVLAFAVLAVTAIVALEDAIPFERAAGVRSESGATRMRRPQPAWARRLPAIILAAVGLGAGLSPLFSAYYSASIWIPVGLCLVVVAAMGVVARPPPVTLPAALLVLGLAGLGLWSLLSTGWAQAAEQATVAGNLWLAYTALVLFVVVFLRRGEYAVVVLACVSVGIAVVAASVLIRLLGSDPAALFLGGRLNSPLGYINGEGCVFGMGIWCGLALAERRQPVLAGVGAAVSVVMADLALLSQSRGAAVATLVALVVALVVIPGWRRRILALAAIAAGFASSAAAVLNVYTVGQKGNPTAAVAHHAGLAIVLAAVVTGLVWAVFVVITSWLHSRRAVHRRSLERAATIVAVAFVVLPLTVALIRVGTIERIANRQWHAFVHLNAPEGGSSAVASGQTRLFSGAGNRYDYWRVAWHVFKAHPVLGVGAGNYPAYYFRARRTQEAIQNPHSLELQTLSELGVVGAVFLALLIVAIVLGIARLRAKAVASHSARGVMVAATGVTVVWLVDTSGDWMHLLPGVTAIALVAMAVLCRPPDAEGEHSPNQEAAQRRRLPALLTGAAAIFVLAIGGASLLRAGLARHYLTEAQAALGKNPAAAIGAAQRSLQLDGANLDAYYVKAAGQARFDRAAAARATLLQAAREDPGNFVTWTLLGDLAVRTGNATAARSYYRRALQLDTREATLRTLVSEPARQLLQSAR